MCFFMLILIMDTYKTSSPTKPTQLFRYQDPQQVFKETVAVELKKNVLTVLPITYKQ